MLTQCHFHIQMFIETCIRSYGHFFVKNTTGKAIKPVWNLELEGGAIMDAQDRQARSQWKSKPLLSLEGQVVWVETRLLFLECLFYF